MKRMMILLSILTILCIIPSVESSFIVSSDEVIVSDNFLIIGGNGEKIFNHTDRVFERGIRIYGKMILDRNVQFFITNQTQYNNWKASGRTNTSGLLYDIPNVSDLSISYRHDLTTTLLFVIWNNNDESCMGELNIAIDRTGPNVVHDISATTFYNGSFEVDFWIEDAHFRVLNASLEILGEIVWSKNYTVYTAIPTLQGSYVINTLEEKYKYFEDKYLLLKFHMYDEGENYAAALVRVYIDNFPPITTPKDNNGGFTWLTPFIFVGMFMFIGIPLYTVKWGYIKYIKQTKQERVDKINEKVKRKKMKEKKDKENSAAEWNDKVNKSKLRKRKKKYGRK